MQMKEQQKKTSRRESKREAMEIKGLLKIAKTNEIKKEDKPIE